MLRVIFPKLKSFIPIRALGVKQFRKYSNGPNCEKAMKCLVDFNIPGFQDAVRKAVAAGEDINKITSNCETLYTCIAKLRNSYLLKMLIETAGPGVVDFKAPNLYGETFKVIIEEEKQVYSVVEQEIVEDVAEEPVEGEPQVKSAVEQDDIDKNIEDADDEFMEEDREISLEILQEDIQQEIEQEVLIEDITQGNESFGAALFNKLAVLNDQPPVMNDGYQDIMSKVEDILPITGQVDMAGDQVENIAEQPVEKAYQKSLIFGSNF